VRLLQSLEVLTTVPLLRQLLLQRTMALLALALDHLELAGHLLCGPDVAPLRLFPLPLQDLLRMLELLDATTQSLDQLVLPLLLPELVLACDADLVLHGVLGALQGFQLRGEVLLDTEAKLLGLLLLDL